LTTAQIEPVTYAFQTPQGSWRVTGSRVSLDSIIHAHGEGRTPQQIVEWFPTLSLEQVHGAIAFYLHHRELLDAYMEQQRQRWEELRQESEVQNRELLERLRAHRDLTARASADGPSS
jgi:uncharacterized protein (DUF433 family)